MQLEDKEARDLIRTELSDSIFVVAGAGSGKTTALVGRVCSMVLERGYSLRSIVAITFTEKAAEELKERLVQSFESCVQDASNPTDVRDLAKQALLEIDDAPIGTIHSFARRILARFADVAGLPAELVVMDEFEFQLDFDRFWDEFVDSVLTESDIQGVLSVLLSGNNMGAIKDLAKELISSKRLLEEALAWSRGAGRLSSSTQVVEHLELQRQILERYRDEIEGAMKENRDPSDALYGSLLELKGNIDDLLDGASDFELVEVLVRIPGSTKVIDQLRVPKSAGRKDNWRVDKKTLVETLNKRAEELRDSVLVLVDLALRSFVDRLSDALLAYRKKRREAGRLSFDDLIDLTVELLGSDVLGDKVRTYLYENYQVVMLDEFQDTDPNQILIAAYVTSKTKSLEIEGDWSRAQMSKGRLFVVGDPKQAIYSFRGADVKLFYLVQSYVSQMGRCLNLVSNFRSTKGVCSFINDLCEQVFKFLPDDMNGDSVVEDVEPFVGFDRLVPVRESVDKGPSVALLGKLPVVPAEPTEKVASNYLRQLEAKMTAAAVVSILEQGWDVYDERLGLERPAKYSDIAILVPTRSSLSELKKALDFLGVPFVADLSLDLLSSDILRSMLMVLASVWDSTDEISTIAALKSPLFCLSSRELLVHRVSCGGGFDYLELGEPSCGCRVEEGLLRLRRLRESVGGLSVHECIKTVMNRFMLYEVTASRPGWREDWKHLDWFLSQAIKWTLDTSDTLGAFLRYIQSLLTSKSSVLEPLSSASERDVVTISTIHKAKGLEYPICILSSMSSRVVGGRDSGTHLKLDADGEVTYRFLGCESPSYDALKKREVQRQILEAQRLMYVAMTRARDHLVVSLFRGADGGCNRSSSSISYSELLSCAGERAAVFDKVEDIFSDPEKLEGIYGLRRSRVDADSQVKDPTDRSSNTKVVEATVRKGFLVFDKGEWKPHSVLEPTGVTSAARNIASFLGDDFERTGGEVQGVEVPELEQFNRPGKIGTALHKVLKLIDLDGEPNLDSVVLGVSRLYGCGDYSTEIAAMALAAIKTATVSGAYNRGAKIRKEVFVSRRSEDLGWWVEGFIDLLIEYEDRVEIIDYKSAAQLPPGKGDNFGRYSYQLALYAWALEPLTQKELVGKVVYLSPAGAKEVLVDIPTLLKRLRSG